MLILLKCAPTITALQIQALVEQLGKESRIHQSWEGRNEWEIAVPDDLNVEALKSLIPGLLNDETTTVTVTQRTSPPSARTGEAAKARPGRHVRFAPATAADGTGGRGGRGGSSGNSDSDEDGEYDELATAAAAAAAAAPSRQPDVASPDLMHLLLTRQRHTAGLHLTRLLEGEEGVTLYAPDGRSASTAAEAAPAHPPRTAGAAMAVAAPEEEETAGRYIFEVRISSDVPVDPIL